MRIYHSSETSQLSSRPDRAWFFFTLLYLVIDYGRPQDLFPFLAYIKPGMLITLTLTVFFLRNIQTGAFQTHNKQIKMMWFFIALLAFFIPFAVNNWSAYIAAKAMIVYMPFILSAVICINSIARLKTTLLTCVCLMTYIAGYSLLHHGMGSGNYFQDENDVALFIDMWIPFCYFLFLSQKKANKVLYGIGLAVGVTAVVACSSRGGFIGLITVFSVIWLFSPRKILSLGIVAFVGTMIVYFAGDAYWTRMATTTEIDKGTALERLQSWKAGWNMFLHNPWGVGGNNFQVMFSEYQPAEMPRGMWGRVAHSLWFTLLPELGVIGVVIYVKLLWNNVRDILFIKTISDADNDEDSRYLSYVSRALIASLAGFFSTASFISVLYYPHYWYLTALIVAITKIQGEALGRVPAIIREEK